MVDWQRQWWHTLEARRQIRIISTVAPMARVEAAEGAVIRESDDHEFARGASRHTVSEAARPERTQQASRPIPPPVRSAHALPAHEFALVRGRCGTYGCLLQDHHLGPCTPQQPASSLRSRSTTR